MSGTANTVRPGHVDAVGGEAPAPVADRRSLRREQTRTEILAAAWDLVRAQGLGALSMRELGGRVGMRAQSLYSYFDSKDAIYDAMFRQGYEAFVEWMAPVIDGADLARPIESARSAAQRYFEFCVDDPVRHQLLFQRTLPGFEPSQESYAVAVEALERSAGALRGIGVDDPVALDLWTAVLAGLTNQQLANDPGGDRWRRLVDRAVHMLVAELAPHLLDPEGAEPSEGGTP